MSQKQYSSKDLELPDDEPMVIIRSSFLWICDGDKYAAAALNMYVHWTRWLMKHRPVARQVNRLLRQQGKTPTQDTSLILYRKQSALVKDLLNFCSEKRLRQANDRLISKGLLKIDDTPRSLSDHVLKYELQIDKLQELIQQWKDQRKGNSEDEFDDEMVEVSLEDDSDGTDNLPSRNGTFTASTSVRNGKFTDRSGKNAVSNNRYNQRDDTSIDKQERENVPPLTRASLFDNDEQRRMDDLYCHHYTHQPKVTEKLKSDYDKLAPGVKTQKDMDSLIELAESRITGDDPVAHPGNLVGVLDAWRLKRRQEEQGPLPWSQPDESPEVAEEPESDIPMYADRPLFYWTEETMETAKFTRTRRNSIRRLQAEWQAQTVVVVSNC